VETAGDCTFHSKQAEKILWLLNCANHLLRGKNKTKKRLIASTDSICRPISKLNRNNNETDQSSNTASWCRTQAEGQLFALIVVSVVLSSEVLK
jgi:hypothetical protein